MGKTGSWIVITKAEKMDYTKDYTALPKNYGTETYYSRDDITAIKKTVWQNLKTLDQQTGFTSKMKDRRFIIE